MKLTPKQQAFVDYYISNGGNGGDAYKKAYSSCKKDDTARVNASRLLTNANVKEYIAEKNNQISNNRIADMKEVKEFWSNVLRGEESDMKDRLKASEFIAKTNGAFLDKIEHSGTVDFNIDKLQKYLKE
jgi:phage terminase small subunit